MSNPNEVYIQYIRWLIADPKERFHKTLSEFMDHHDLSNADIEEFENKPTYVQDFEREIKNWGLSKLPEVIREAHKQALTGRAASIRAFKDLLEDNKNKGNTVNFFSINPTPEQYQKILSRENNRITENR